jgi:PAS domain S-box-containing protein
MIGREKIDQYRRLLEMQQDACLIETDASGIISYFGPAAAEFFGCRAEEVLGKLHYSAFHDRAEMESCANDPDFMRSIEEQGYSENVWIIRPRGGGFFKAKVTLIPIYNENGNAAERIGWIALYRRIAGEPGNR